MGVSGLKRLLEKLAVAQKHTLQPGEPRTILIDGSCLSSLIHNNSQKAKTLKAIQMYFGAQWQEFFSNLQVILKKLADCNFQVVVVFDGVDEDIKKDTMKGRHTASKDKVMVAVERIREHRVPTYEVPPSGWRHILQSMLQSLKIPVIQAPFEADSFIITYCRENPIWAILANDYDFCVLPYINKFLDITSWNLDDMTINCVDRKQQLDIFKISQEMLTIFGCILSKDFSTDSDRESMASYIKAQIPPRKYLFVDTEGRRDRSQEDIAWNEAVLEWILSKKDSTPKDLLNELAKVFPGVRAVYDKFVNFESPKMEESIIDRLAYAGLHIPQKIVEDFRSGLLTVSDISYFINDCSSARGLEDEQVFHFVHHDMMKIASRIKPGILFPPPKPNSSGSKDLDEAQKILTALSLLESLAKLKGGSRPTWKNISTSFLQTQEFTQKLLSDFADPLFLYSVYEYGNPTKIYPVRLLDEQDHIIHPFSQEYSTATPQQLKSYFVMSALATTPKYVGDNTRSLNVKIVQKDFASLLSKLQNLPVSDTVFCLSVYFMLNNGLNKLLYERELDGLILQFLVLKKELVGTVSSSFPPPITVRSATLYTFMCSVFNFETTLCRYFRVPFEGQPFWNYLHGQVFHHFLTSKQAIDPQLQEQFLSLKSLILELVVFEPNPVQDDAIPEKLTTDEPRKAPCKFLIEKGYCAYGDKCKYSHDVADLGDSSVSSASPFSSTFAPRPAKQPYTTDASPVSSASIVPSKTWSPPSPAPIQSQTPPPPRTVWAAPPSSHTQHVPSYTVPSAWPSLSSTQGGGPNLATSPAQTRNFYSHASEYVPASQPRYTSTRHIPCRFYAEGRCNKGVNCEYSHSGSGAAGGGRGSPQERRTNQ